MAGKPTKAQAQLMEGWRAVAKLWTQTRLKQERLVALVVAVQDAAVQDAQDRARASASAQPTVAGKKVYIKQEATQG